MTTALRLKSFYRYDSTRINHNHVHFKKKTFNTRGGSVYICKKTRFNKGYVIISVER
jgi:hypothetical protein